jgi:glucose/arabinose dehydrogenase
MDVNARFIVVSNLFVCLVVGVVRAQSVVDPALQVQTYFGGLDQPTGVAFINGLGDALVTQKNDGRVILFRNKKRIGTALDLPVASSSEHGLLSIALSPNFAMDRFVYLYHTVAGADGGDPIANRISRYKLSGDRLVYNRAIINLPATPGPNHDGGKIAFDRRGLLYTVIGDLNRNERTQNFENSSQLTSTGAILRLTPNGQPVATNPFNTTGAPKAQARIYAYGVRNSFGIAFDPVTGNLWDTENGPDRMDEINQVRAGFNSGWQDVMGPSSRQGGFSQSGLVKLGAQANYSEPELSWEKPVAPTDLHFYEGARLGESYRNDLFAGDVNTGSLYHFDLTTGRKSLRLTGPLTDYVVNNTGNLLDEQGSIRFGNGFGVTTDLLSGPGGLFVLSLSQGKLYRISQKMTRQSDPMTMGAMTSDWMPMTYVASVPEPASAAMGAVGALVIAHSFSRRGHAARGRGFIGERTRRGRRG